MATPKLAAVILACNEDNVLARCLQSLQGVAELHVSIDTATTDGTEAVARQFTQNIYRHCLAETNSYSAARNGLQEAAEQATDAGWFLWIDPDEWLEPQHAQLLPGVIAEAEERDAQALMVRMYDLGLEGSGIDPSSWLNSKVFRRGMRFARRRHEHLTPTDVRRLEAPQVVIHHQKRQRPDVIQRNNGIKDNLQALIDDWQEFRDQRAACYAGDCYAHAHRWHDAVSWYLQGLGCPDTVMGARGQLLQGLCRSYQNLGEFDKARQALFEFWSEDWHNTGTALVELGAVALNAGSLDEAALYFRLLNATPDNVQSQLNVGATSPRESSVLGAAMVSCARGNYPEALQWLCKAIALAGRETPAHVALREKIVAAMTAAPEAAHAQ